MKIRKARIPDLKDIHRLINEFARREEMIARSMNELYENIRDFYVADDGGKVIGVCALHILWEDLAEVRSLAVNREFQGRGIGKRLVQRCIGEAKSMGIRRVFVLTYQDEFFRKMGFNDIDKTRLPQKIWGDCIRCHKFPECDETALIATL